MQAMHRVHVTRFAEAMQTPKCTATPRNSRAKLTLEYKQPLEASAKSFANAQSSMSLKQADPEVVEALRRKLQDKATSLEAKYRVLFSLRNIEGSQAQAAMLEGAEFKRNGRCFARWRRIRGGCPCVHLHARIDREKHSTSLRNFQASYSEYTQA